jgi:formylglycine-generating enzyme required for sulfatase activity
LVVAKKIRGKPVIEPEMVTVPAGTFWMGAPDGEPESSDGERPVHQVTFERPFSLGKFPITFAEWDAAQAHPDWTRLGGLPPYRPDDHNWGRLRRPVINVSWDDAVGYCRWLVGVTGLPYRLPSEAEWEYACRAGTSTPFYFGATIDPTQANYDGNYIYDDPVSSDMMHDGLFRQETTEVGTVGHANAFGLHDMHGNVWELCADLSHKNYNGAPSDGSVWLGQPAREAYIARGGSWQNHPIYVRSAMRDFAYRNNRSVSHGFRVARSY